MSQVAPSASASAKLEFNGDLGIARPALRRADGDIDTPVRNHRDVPGGDNSADQRREHPDNSDNIGRRYAPRTASFGRSGIEVSTGNPKAQIEVYGEPLCLPCGLFEQSNGPEVAQAIDSGDLAVSHRTLTFLDDRSSSGSYSTRAGAARCASRTSPGPRGLSQLRGVLPRPEVAAAP